ncbi:sulfotransferase [Pseudoalteromonas sp. C2R02]|uniref:sulfotransferase family protein n=1 Tax=Pseudoalteromonas sp. C2R02 TaxID=2841565 RepID=UPI001C08F44E|nr:sulfotransferase [Pseudoalteromonas sp. C2R02]
MSHWIADKNCKLPDFIISGAMKSGTTSLHAILNQHPDIFIPDKELHFFDMDNPLQHPDFNSFKQGKWSTHNLAASTQQEAESYWLWYQSQFSGASGEQVLGEDSATYFASPLFAKRIAQQDKKIKIIVMLRQPSLRAHSNYYHLLRSGRATYSFEDTLKFNPSSVLNRSLYLDQIESIYKYLPKDQVKFVIFEQFLKNKTHCIKEICEFIDIDFSRLPKAALDIHENKTKYPKFPKLQYLKNRWLPQGGNLQYKYQFKINSTELTFWQKLSVAKVLDVLHRKINPEVTIKPEKIKPSTKLFLDNYFKTEFEGIEKYLDDEVLNLWFDK